jgi:hypothetical protein
MNQIFWDGFWLGIQFILPIYFTVWAMSLIIQGLKKA